MSRTMVSEKGLSGLATSRCSGRRAGNLEQRLLTTRGLQRKRRAGNKGLRISANKRSIKAGRCSWQVCWTSEIAWVTTVIAWVKLRRSHTIFAVPSQKVLKLLKGHEVP